MVLLLVDRVRVLDMVSLVEGEKVVVTFLYGPGVKVLFSSHLYFPPRESKIGFVFLREELQNVFRFLHRVLYSSLPWGCLNHKILKHDFFEGVVFSILQFISI